MEQILYFLSLLFCALSMSFAICHLDELPNKISLPAKDYLTAQQIHRGWNKYGSFDSAAILLTMILMWMIPKDDAGFLWAGIGLIFLISMRIVVGILILPANQQTQNWTQLPLDWKQLRIQWEFSQAVRAGFAVAAFCSLLISALMKMAAQRS